LQDRTEHGSIEKANWCLNFYFEKTKALFGGWAPKRPPRRCDWNWRGATGGTIRIARCKISTFYPESVKILIISNVFLWRKTLEIIRTISLSGFNKSVINGVYCILKAI